MARSCLDRPIRTDLQGCTGGGVFASFGGDREDHDLGLHPLGCRHAPGRVCIVGGCEETWSTRIAGGLPAIQCAIEAIERRADGVDGTLRVECAGMDLSLHSLLLVCEGCMRHSVVSYECYLRTLRGSVVGREGGHEDDGGWCGITGVHVPFATAGEYYLFVACTAGLYTTPCFSLSCVPAGPARAAPPEGVHQRERQRQQHQQQRPSSSCPATVGIEEVGRMFKKKSRRMQVHAAGVGMDVDVQPAPDEGQQSQQHQLVGGGAIDWRALELALQSDEEEPEVVEGPDEGMDVCMQQRGAAGGAFGPVEGRGRKRREEVEEVEEEEEEEVEEEEQDTMATTWAMTLWLHASHTCQEELMQGLVASSMVRFIAYEEGSCPSTGGLFYRAFLSFWSPKYKSKLLRWFGRGHHYEAIRTQLRRDTAYLSAEHGLTKLGSEPRLQGFKRKRRASRG